MSAQSLAISPSARIASGEAGSPERRRAPGARRPGPLPAARRLEALRSAGYNAFLLSERAVFLDLCAEPGANAMGDARVAASSAADGTGPAGLAPPGDAIRRIFGKAFLLPLPRGLEAERLICAALVGLGSLVPMNHRSATIRAQVEGAGGSIVEFPRPGALDPDADRPFKGDMDEARLEGFLAGPGGERTAFVRMEAAVELTGGQPFSPANLRAVSRAARSRGIPLVLDAGRLAENALLAREREPGVAGLSPAELFREMADLADLVCFQPGGPAGGGGAILASDPVLFDKMRDLASVFGAASGLRDGAEGGLASMAADLRAALDEAVTGRSPDLAGRLAARLQAAGVPVASPSGALGVQVDAKAFLPGLRAADYPAGALAAAFYLVSGVRGLERGGLSAGRHGCGAELPADRELFRLDVARRGLSPAELRYAEDRLEWLFANRGLVGGLRFVEEPATLRFRSGRLEATGDWPERLVAAFRVEFGEGP